MMIATFPPGPPDEPDMLQLIKVISNLCITNLEKASSELINPRGLELDSQDESTISSETAFHALNAADAKNRGEHTHHGLPAIQEDISAHRRLEELIMKCGIPALANSVVVGEEAVQQMWIRARALRVGLVVVLDAIDGSSRFDTLSSGHSTNVLVYRKAEDNYELMLAIVVTGRHTVAWMAPNRVFIRANREPFQEINEPRSANPRPGYVATVGAMPHHREKIAALLGTDPDPSWELPPYQTGDKVFHNPAPTVFTDGAAPAVVGLAIGRLSAMIITSQQTLHDAAQLPALIALGLPIHGATGPLDPAELMELFNQLSGPGTGDAYTPIPPFVVGRDENFVAKLARRVLGDESRGIGSNVVNFPGGGL